MMNLTTATITATTKTRNRMMLSDSKLLARLKRELDGISAPLQADAQVFQNKITEASERQEVTLIWLRNACFGVFPPRKVRCW